MKKSFYQSNWYMVLNITAVIVIITSRVLRTCEVINIKTSLFLTGLMLLIIISFFINMLFASFKKKN